MAPLSVEEDNYIRLLLLLIDVCPRAVRSYFDKEFPPDKLYSRFNTNYNTFLSLKSHKILNQDQWERLFPRNGMFLYCIHFVVVFFVIFTNNIRSTTGQTSRSHYR